MKGREPMSEQIETTEVPTGMDRRSVLKRGALLAGVAAFAQPVVAGVFSSPAEATHLGPCSAATDSEAVTAVTISGQDWNSNSAAGYPFGRYNGQNRGFQLPDGTQGVIRLGLPGVDNFDVRYTFYVVDITGYTCQVNFSLGKCGDNNKNDGLVLYSRTTNGGAFPVNQGPVPFCAHYLPTPTPAGFATRADYAFSFSVPSSVDYTDPNVEIKLDSIVCCPN